MRYYIIKHDILISGDTFPTAMLCLPSEQCTSIIIHKIQFYRLNITSDCLSMLKGSFFPYFFPPWSQYTMLDFILCQNIYNLVFQFLHIDYFFLLLWLQCKGFFHMWNIVIVWITFAVSFVYCYYLKIEKYWFCCYEKKKWYNKKTSIEING